VRTGLNFYERDESLSYFRDLYSFDAITGFSQDSNRPSLVRILAIRLISGASSATTTVHDPQEH
jgi:hypothetical protein